ncbi:MAG: DUF1015 domain-containing protein [Nitrospinae bacterium]|nr:DUF1015 domain-containing protein [Nitrospinota bacterium]
MVKVIPFRGILYNKEKIKTINSVIAPPYDIISNVGQDKYYLKNNYNIIRLIYGKDLPWDDPMNDRYIRSARYFEDWLERGILISDKNPSIYIYMQEYSIPSHIGHIHKEERPKKRRVGFIALLKLEEFGKGNIFPHEETLPQPKEDRLQVMRRCRANLCQIFGVYSDPQMKINNIMEMEMKREPLINITDDGGDRHSLWAITDVETQDKIISEIEDKKIFIADGHHRYETAITYRDEMRSKTTNFTGNDPYNYIMIYLTNSDADGLTILPTHRLIKNLPSFNKDEIERKIGEYFLIESFPFKDKGEEPYKRIEMFKEMENRGNKGHVFGMYFGENRYLLLSLRNEAIMDELIDYPRTKEWKRLDVTILHTLLIEKILNIKRDSVTAQRDITYVTDEEEMIHSVEEGGYQIAFFLTPTKIEEVQKIAMSGERMPQKSTFFYPKLLTGLVINSL